MILTCDHCGTSYQLDDTLVQPAGTKVRCSYCKRLWTVVPPAGVSDSASGLPTEAADLEGSRFEDALTAGMGTAAATSLLFDDDDAGGREPGLQNLDDDLDMDGLGAAEFDDDILDTDELSLDDLESILDMESSEDAAGGSGGDEPSDDDADTDELSLDELEKMLEAEGGLVESLDLSDEDTGAAEERYVGVSTTQDEISLAELDADDDLAGEAFEPREEEELVLDLPDITEVEGTDENDQETPLNIDTKFRDDLDVEDTGVEPLFPDDLEQIPTTGETEGDDADAEYINLDSETLFTDGDEVAASSLADAFDDDIPLMDADELVIEEMDPDTETIPAEGATDSPDRESESEPLDDPLAFPQLDLDDEPDTASESMAGADDDTGQGDDIELEVADELKDLLGGDEPDINIEETEELNIASVSAELAKDKPEGEETQFDELDFSLELSPEIEEIFGEAEDESIFIEETEELDLSTLSDDPEPALVDDSAGENTPFELELDLTDSESGDGVDMDDGLNVDDLSDLELEIESAEDETRELDPDLLESASEAGSPLADGDHPEVEDFELDLDLDALEGQGQPLSLDIDNDAPDLLSDEEDRTRELDMSTLESILGDEEPKDEIESSTDGNLDEFDLNLDLENLADDAEEEDDATRELDLSDIERMLEAEPEPSSKSETDMGEDDLSLDGVDASEATQEIDLQEIERLLDVEDTTDKTLAPREEIDDLDLDLDLSSSADEDMDLELNFDLHDDEGDEEPSALFDTTETQDIDLDLDLTVDDSEASRQGLMEDDLDLEFEVLEEAAESSTTVDEGGAGMIAGAGAAVAAGAINLSQETTEEKTLSDKAGQAKKAIPSKPMPKKGGRGFLLFLLLLLIIAAGGYYVTQYTTIQIPFVSEWIGKGAEVAVSPVEASLKGYFVENASEGPIYIIEGRVRNDTGSSVSFIEVTGRVFATGKTFQRASKSFCGNVLSREDLQQRPLADIQKQLLNRRGADNRNVRLPSGSDVPFMVVFGNLPQNIELEEFTVEVSNSMAVK